jgi:hypothetical protein
MTETAETSPRSMSPDGTVIEHNKEQPKGAMPEVDLALAATIKPSRLRGRNLMFMVTFVAGTGVSACHSSSLIVVHHVWLRSGCFE